MSTKKKSVRAKSVFSGKTIDIGFNCCPDNNDAYKIVAARAFDVRFYSLFEDGDKKLSKFLDDFKPSYGGRVYSNRNGIMALLNMDGEIERTKDFIVCVEYKCGDHDIFNLTGGEFLSRFATVDPLKKKVKSH